MAISIDRVYQKVLAFANKEQRGYITPQEFNLFADQAQMEIFEQYFYDTNQWTRQHGNSHEYSDMLVNLEEKIDKFAFIATGDNVTVLNRYGDINLSNDLPDLYRLGDIRVKYPGAGYKTAEQLRSRKELIQYGSAPLTRQSEKRPVFHRHTTIGGIDRIKIYPYPVEDDGSPIDLSTDEVDLTLPHVNVTSIDHPWDNNGYYDEGKNFFFDQGSMETIIGYPITVGMTQDEDIVAVRNGVTIFEGRIRIFGPHSAGSPAANARKNLSYSTLIAMGLPGGNPYGAYKNDWQVGDKIFMPGDLFLDDQRNVQVDYIRKPKTPSWGYVVVNDKALYNSTSSTDFQLHSSEESELVYRILAFAGVAIEKPQLTQVAAGLEQAKVQQEKQ